jgi:hypothetical protein
MLWRQHRPMRDPETCVIRNSEIILINLNSCNETDGNVITQHATCNTDPRDSCNAKLSAKTLRCPHPHPRIARCGACFTLCSECCTFNDGARSNDGNGRFHQSRNGDFELPRPTLS